MTESTHADDWLLRRRTGEGQGVPGRDGDLVEPEGVNAGSANIDDIEDDRNPGPGPIGDPASR